MYCLFLYMFQIKSCKESSVDQYWFIWWFKLLNFAGKFVMRFYHDFTPELRWAVNGRTMLPECLIRDIWNIVSLCCFKNHLLHWPASQTWEEERLVETELLWLFSPWRPGHWRRMWTCLSILVWNKKISKICDMLMTAEQEIF